MQAFKAAQVARFGQDQIKETYAKYEKFVPALAFFAGTLFDILTVGRVDDRLNLIQQAVYLTLCMGLLIAEIFEVVRPYTVPKWLAKVWHYREEAQHFLLGSLLSAFTIMFFKSSSLVGSSLFFLLIGGLLIGNEFSEVRKFGLVLRSIMFSLCVTSYMFCVVPIAWHGVGLGPFLTALGASLLVGGIFTGILWKVLPNQDVLKRHVMIPYAGLVVLLLGLYGLRLVPPIPLAIKHIGIYRSVERVQGGYKVKFLRPWWRFWSHGDQSYTARAGDRIFCFFSIFSPGGFKERIKIRWLYDDPKKGWTAHDAMPVAISGGRDDGYRGFAFKANYEPGSWQVRIETQDELEIGRIYVDVDKDDEPTQPREVFEETM